MMIIDKQLIKDALYITPCHVTGMHSPNHHLEEERICDLQKRELLERILKAIDVDIMKLPRRLHDDCYWCNESERKKEHKKWVKGKLPKKQGGPQ